jgi:hypothetical protein
MKKGGLNSHEGNTLQVQSREHKGPQLYKASMATAAARERSTKAWQATTVFDLSLTGRA